MRPSLLDQLGPPTKIRRLEGCRRSSTTAASAESSSRLPSHRYQRACPARQGPEPRCDVRESVWMGQSLEDVRPVWEERKFGPKVPRQDEAERVDGRDRRIQS